MVKKVRLILALVVALLSVGIGNFVFAGGPGNSTTETTVAVIGENVQMSVQKPLQVITESMWTTIKWEEGKIAPIYPGQTIGNGKIVVANVSPINQAAILLARPITVAGGDLPMPNFEVVATSSGATYSPWQQIVIAPGTTIDLKIEVKVAYGGSVSSPFNGVELVVLATSPQNRPSGCDPQGC